MFLIFGYSIIKNSGMAEFSFKQLIYGGMVSIAGVDGSVTSLETKYINQVFNKHQKMSPEEKNRVLSMWTLKGEEAFTDLLIQELLTFPKQNQIEAFSYIMSFINWSKAKYNQNLKKDLKPDESIKAELDLYHKRAEYIMRSLSFSAKEYAITTRDLPQR